MEHNYVTVTLCVHLFVGLNAENCVSEFSKLFFLKCALNVFSSKAGHRSLVIRQPGTTEADLGGD